MFKQILNKYTNKYINYFITFNPRAMVSSYMFDLFNSIRIYVNFHYIHVQVCKSIKTTGLECKDTIRKHVHFPLQIKNIIFENILSIVIIVDVSFTVQ